MSETIGTAYVDIRPTPNAEQVFKRDVADVIEPGASAVRGRVSQALADGLKTPAGGAAAGAAVGTVLGQGVAKGLHAAMRGVTLLPRIGFEEVKDYQAGLAQLQAGLKSTGGAAGLTADQMEGLAGKIQKYSGQTDDSIVRAESFLLTFSKVRDTVGAGNDVFTRATKATADLAARLGGDAAGNALLLGKALNDPVAGMGALARAGIQFDDAQKKTIKSLVQTGDLLGAQKIVLEEVEKQVGGSAKAYGDTLPGQIDRAKRAFEDFSQGAVTRTLDFVEHNQTTVKAVGATVAALVIAHKAIATYQALQTTVFAGVARKSAANAALARSYDGVAVSASRAAAAEAAAAGGGVAAGAGAAAAGGGVAAGAAGGGVAAGAGLGLASAATIAAAAVAAMALVVKGFDIGERDKLRQGAQERGAFGGFEDFSGPYSEQVGHVLSRGLGGIGLGRVGRSLDRATGYSYDIAAYNKKQTEDAKRYAPIDTSSLVDPALARTAQALASARAAYSTAASALKTNSGAGAFDVLPSRVSGDVPAAREAKRKADRAVAEAERNLEKVRGGSGGASTAQITSAEARVAAAEAALRKRGGDGATERARLAAAEAHLSELRGKGGVNTDKLREAEDRLAEARRAAGDAADEKEKAEKTTALSVGDILGRVTGQAKNARALRDDSRVLIKDGLSKGVLEELQKLEKEAPGTMDRVAKSLTPAMAKQLNSQYAAVQQAQQEFLTAPLRAAVQAAKAEQDKALNDAAAQQAAAYQRALKNNQFGGLTPTTPSTPDAPAPGNQRGDGIDHRNTAVHVTLTGVPASTVHGIATDAVARHDRATGALVVGP